MHNHGTGYTAYKAVVSDHFLVHIVDAAFSKFDDLLEYKWGTKKIDVDQGCMSIKQLAERLGKTMVYRTCTNRRLRQDTDIDVFFTTFSIWYMEDQDGMYALVTYQPHHNSHGPVVHDPDPKADVCLYYKAFLVKL